MSIERLAREHAAAYRALMLEAYAAHPDAFTSSAGERSALALAWWEERLAGGAGAGELVLGAFEARTLVGVAGVAFHTREKLRHKARLFGMYVRAGQRGRGLARRLVEAALEAARARPGVELVQLTVTSGNGAAERLYRRCGFEPFGLEPRALAVTGGYADKLHMWRALER